MNKILFCASRVSHIINFHMPYIEYYKSCGWQVDVVAEGDLCSNKIDNFYNLKFDKRHISLNNISTMIKLSNLIKKENYTIITSHSTLAGFICKISYFTSGNKSSRFIHISHGYLFKDDNSLKSKIYILGEKVTSNIPDLLITMNDEDYRIAKKYKFAKNIKFINGIGLDTKKLLTYDRHTVEKLKSQLHISDRDFVILCVGEMSKRKNQEFILNAMHNLNKPYVKIIFAGDGDMLEHYIKIAKFLNIYDKTIFLGHISKIDLFYQISNAVVSASRYEGMPFNIMEAMYYNIPVLASNIKGHNDLIKSHKNGILFELDTPDNLTKSINQLIESQSFYNKIKANTCLDKKFNLENVKPMIISYYYNPMIF